MKDKARVWTDKKLASMEKEVAGIYKEAAKDIQKKWDGFMEKSNEAISKYQKIYDDAKASGDKELIKSASEKLEKIKYNQTLGSEKYKELLNSTTKELARANQTALAYVNNQIPSVYAKNFAQVGSELGNIKPLFKSKEFNAIKAIVNEDVIKRRIADGTIDTPFMRSAKFLNIPKDMRWNTKKINSSVLQGIIQGESMDKIADRILPIVGNNESAAIRNARTIVTGAENQGRLDSYERLAEEGLVMKKVWIATADDRTRESHLFMDGQEAEIDEPFEDGDGNELEYPGDPLAPPETVYNCRCSMRTQIVGKKRDDGTIDYIKHQHEDGLHQEQIFHERHERKMVQ